MVRNLKFKDAFNYGNEYVLVKREDLERWRRQLFNIEITGRNDLIEKIIGEMERKCGKPLHGEPRGVTSPG